VARVRAEAEHWLAFLEPSSARNLGLPTHLPEFSFDRVVYAPHSYNADAEAGLGFDPAARAALVANVQQFKVEAERWGGAVWIGEFGGNANHPGIAEYMGAQYDAAGLIGAGQMYWEYSQNDGYGFLDSGGEEKPLLAAALVRPWPERIYGNDLSWSFEAATRTFHLSYHPVVGTSAPSELVIPPRVYPEGFAVECGGCRYETPAGRLKILDPTGGVTVTPLD
jgi:endoglycosylceramidase